MSEYPNTEINGIASIELALIDARKANKELVAALREAADYIKNGELYEDCNSEAINKYRKIAERLSNE